MYSARTAPTALAAFDAPRRLGPALLVVLALGAIPYLFGLGGAFVYDDETLLLANPQVQDLTRLPELLSSSLWSFTTAPTEARVEYWRPLTSLAFALTWAVGGGSVLAFKLASLAAHLVAVALVARLGLQLVGRRDVALAGALLFAVHPVGVEAVTWASALNDPLMLALGLGALTSWITWRRAGSLGRPWRAVSLLALAVFAKEAALAFVLVLALLDAIVLRSEIDTQPRSARRGWLAIAAALLVYWLLRVGVFGNWHGGLLSTNVRLDASVARLLALRVELMGGGLGLALWPADLRVFRPIPLDVGIGELWAPIALVFAFVVAADSLERRGDRAAFVLAAWPLVLLAPLVLRVNSLGQFPLSDRFVYATVPGVALLVALLAFRGARRVSGTGRGRSVETVAPWVLVALAAAALGHVGARRTQAWETPAGFWRHAAEQDPNVALVQWNLGRLALEEFRETPMLPVAERAFDHFQDALDIAEGQKPGVNVAGSQFDRLQSYLGTGWALLQQAEVDGYGNYETPLSYFELVLGLAALADGEEAVPIVPGGQNSHEAWTGRGVALARLGRVPEAIDSFQSAIELYPEYAPAHFNKGLVHWRAGEAIPASNHLGRAFELQPNSAEYAEFAGWSEADRGRAERARELANVARDLDPARSGPLVLLGILARRDDRPVRALELLTRAVEIDASDARAHKELGETHLALGDPDEALAAFVEACRLGPNLFEPHWNAASLLLSANVPPADVLPYLRRAYELCPDPARIGQLRANLDLLLEPGHPLRRELALFDERRGALDAALHWARTAASANDEDGASAYVFGRLLLRDDNAEGAVEWLEIANRRRPDQFPRLRELGAARAAAGDLGGARAAWERALEVLPPAPEEQQWQEERLREEIRARIASLGAGE